MENGRWKMEDVHGKWKMFCVLTVMAGLFIMFTACGKQTEQRPASLTESESPAPFSRGPTGPPKISAPTYLPPE